MSQEIQIQVIDDQIQQGGSRPSKTGQERITTDRGDRKGKLKKKGDPKTKR